MGTWLSWSRGRMAHGKYPTAYWGSLAGKPSKIGQNTVNWAWNAAERDQVIYACVPLP